MNIINESIQLLEYSRKEFKDWAKNNDLVNTFIDMRAKLQAPENDMGYWIKNKTPDDLDTFLKNYKSKTQKKKEETKEGSEEVYNDGTWQIIRCDTYDAMKHYGKGTKWCIAGNYPGHTNDKDGRYYFDNYLGRPAENGRFSNYFVVINKGMATGDYNDNKWCACSLRQNPGQFDIYNAKDYEVGSIPGLPPIEGFESCCQFVIKDNVLISTKNEGGEIVVPEGVTEIAPRVFFNQRLDSIKLPNSLKIIGKGAFANAHGFSSIYIPDSVIEIGDYAFCANARYTDVVNEIIIGSSVEKIGDRAFAFHSLVNLIKFKGPTDDIATSAFALTGIQSRYPTKIEYNVETPAIARVVDTFNKDKKIRFKLMEKSRGE